MDPLSQDRLTSLRAGLIDNLRLDHFDDAEIEVVLSDIAALDRRIRQKTLALCLALSHASSSFVISALKRIRKASALLSPVDLERWITQAFDLLDARGIDPFIRFMQQAEDPAMLRRFRSPRGLRLQSVMPVLEPYVRGLSGLDLKIAPAGTAHTDTATLYLPAAVNACDKADDNFLLYKLMSVHLWAQIAGGSLVPDGKLLGEFAPGHDGPADIETLFTSFSDRAFAVDLYALLETFRLAPFLFRELPGIMRSAEDIRQQLFEGRPVLHGLSEKAALVEGLCQTYLAGITKGTGPAALDDAIEKAGMLGGNRDSAESFALVRHFHDHASGEYVPLAPPPFFGIIRPRKVSRLLAARRNARKKHYEGVITKLLTQPDFEPQHSAMAKKKKMEERVAEPGQEYLLLKGRMIELDSELREIVDERGGIPGGILVKGSDLGATSPITLADLAAEDAGETDAGGGILYDEWDYRRGGYKKHFCSLYEHDLHPGHEPFVEMTLQRYGGYVTTLRKKFELMKRQPRTLRRQKDGEDVDIDAAVEAFADQRAGLSPSEDLFTRIDRQERNIAVLFLLDMSGSTKGWVSEAEKEALVLMSEALEALGDTYGIYGFSGMTRTKNDFYRIKGFDESYADMVKRRIAGIGPKDYTRMGPPIRHSLNVLRTIEARTKLLIILSDGKPEDWDAYKGEYAIEDTRKSLIEVREAGIHPFCITIDKEARSYLPHMYGETHYTLIDDVKKLPNRITEIYRRLTT
jgi:nitric oxide reductase NorD protein